MFIYNLQAIAEKLKIDYDSVTSKIEHNGVKGTAREDLLKQNLSSLFPKRYSICSGVIIDSNQKQSRQQDFIIYDSFNCPAFYETESNKILPIESVYATIEIKSTLTKETLKQCIDNIKSVRSLEKEATPYSKIFKYPVGFVFAYSSDSSLETIQKNLFELNKDINPDYQISIICILDKGLIFNVRKENIVEYTVYPNSNTTIGCSKSDLSNNLYSFYLLIMQYLNSVHIDTPNLLDYAIKMDAFKVGVSIPAELLTPECRYNQNGINTSYGEVMDLLNINKKYPNLSSPNLSLEELKSYIKNDMVYHLSKLNEINGGSANNINMDFYGYKMNANDFNNFKELLKSSDENDSIKVDSIIDEMYEKYKKQYKIDD